MNNSNLNLEKQQRKTVLPCPVCGKSLRKEFFFRGRNDRFMCCSSCKTELQTNLRRKETAVFIAIVLVVMGIFSGLYFGLHGSWRWLSVIVLPLSLLIQLYMPGKCIYLTSKENEKPTKFTPDEMQRQSKLRKTKLLNIACNSIVIAFVIATVVCAVIFIFVDLSSIMIAMVVVSISVILFFMLFTIQSRRLEQQDNDLSKINKWTNPQGETHGKKMSSRQLIILFLVILYVIGQIVLIAMVFSG